MNKEYIIQILLSEGQKIYDTPKKTEIFGTYGESGKLIDNLKEYPHAFVLGCIMDRQIKAERAWKIPYLVFLEVGKFDIQTLSKFSLEYYKELFNKKKLHRFNDDMAKNFYFAIQLIKTKYKGNASLIWENNLKSSTIVRRFLEFKGVGIKIATMATNILARDFKIKMQDTVYIDVSPDVHVIRVLKRIGFVNKDASIDDVVYCAREINPNYPGILDFSLWEIGRNWCHEREKPKCENCLLNKYCPKII